MICCTTFSSWFNTLNLIWSTSDNFFEINCGLVQSLAGLTKSSLSRFDMMIEVFGDEFETVDNVGDLEGLDILLF